MDKAIDVRPLIAMMNQDMGTYPAQRPDSPEDGLQPDAVFVHGPKLNPARRQEVLKGLHQFREGFF
jgi:hypothetical protein